MSDDVNFILQARREKLGALEAAGIPAFGYSYARTHLACDAVRALGDGDEGPAVSVAGRVVAWRSHGKTTFAHLADVSGKIQLYFRKDELGEHYTTLAHLDLGDIIGVRGTLFRTRTGEATVRVQSLELLAKSLSPLPFGKEEEVNGQIVRHSGFADPEQRYRQRYADLAVHPDVRAIFVARSRMTTAIRAFLDARAFIEVETPVLQPLYGGALARPFTTHHNALDRTLYLRIATELYLKRCIVGGLERVYELGKDFRNEGLSTKHNPEFTMVEFYEAYADYNDVADRMETLVRTVARSVGTVGPIDFQAPWRRITLRDAIRDASGVDFVEHPDRESLAAAIGDRLPTHKRTWPQLVDDLLSHFVEPGLLQPTFLMDYPVELSPFAKAHRSQPGLVERWEAFCGGVEIANAFTELNDPDEQRARFESQARLAAEGDDEAAPYDDVFVEALEQGMPPTGGVGLGIDRLVMALRDRSSIREVVLFPAMRDA